MLFDNFMYCNHVDTSTKIPCNIINSADSSYLLLLALYVNLLAMASEFYLFTVT